MGVTSGGLFANEHQIITIEIPDAPASTEAGLLAQDLQAVIDAFNADFGANTLEVL
jgi:hypothetical protein